MGSYKVIDHLSRGLIIVYSSRYRDQMWYLTEQKVRKDHKCQICRKEILRGKDKAYSPLSNLSNRMDRICFSCGVA